MDKYNEKDDGKAYSETSSEILMTWNEHQEQLLKGIAERSNCMRWLHTESSQYFDSLNFYFTIPNVVISTLNGSFTMSLTSLFPDPATQKSATTIIGLISIFSAVLITMNQYVKSQQMMEANRAASLSYGKLYRIIMNELALRRDQRTNGLEFLKLVRMEIDRLENTAPSIPPFIIKKFSIQFAERNIEKPEIAGDLDPININTQQKLKKSTLSPRIGIDNRIVQSASQMFNNSASSSPALYNGSRTSSKDDNSPAIKGKLEVVRVNVAPETDTSLKKI
jgi:hypothetical protein